MTRTGDQAFLIARREFVDHVRTRGFWLSLGTVPLILALSLSIPLVSEATRPGLAFAVTDHSGWALDAIVQRADARDLERLLARAPDARAPKPLAVLLETWSAEDGASIAERVRALVASPRAGPEQSFLSWYRRLDRDAMRRLDPRAWRARFRLVHAPDRWVPAAEARMNLADDRIFAWFEIPEDPIGRPDAPVHAVRYAARNLTNDDLRDWFDAQLDAVVIAQRRAESDVPSRLWDWISAGSDVQTRTVGADGRARSASRTDILVQWGPVAFVYILWISIQVVTQMLLSSTVEEKSGKLIEVLLASTAPTRIMAGKILGIAATGLVIVTVWLVTFVVAALLLPRLLGVSGVIDLAPLATNPVYLLSFVVYYLLGYLFYAALLCGIGALCSTLKEAQTLAIPIQSMLFVPLVAMVPIARDPSGTLATVLTWVPPFTPFVMMNRAAQPPGVEIYLATTALMIGAIACALFLGARLFRAGVLMTGQAPGIGQALRLVLVPVRARDHDEGPETASR